MPPHPEGRPPLPDTLAGEILTKGSTCNITSELTETQPYILKNKVKATILPGALKPLRTSIALINVKEITYDFL